MKSIAAGPLRSFLVISCFGLEARNPLSVPGMPAWEFPNLVHENLAVCNFYVEALFCALLRPFCALVRFFADLRLRSFQQAASIT